MLDAAAKGVNEETVRRAIRSVRLAAQRIGNSFVIRAADLDAWRPHYERAPRRKGPDGPSKAHENRPHRPANR